MGRMVFSYPAEGSGELNSSDKIMVHLSSEEGEEQDSKRRV